MEDTSTRAFAISELSYADNLYISSAIFIQCHRNIINNDLYLLVTSYYMQRYIIDHACYHQKNNNNFDRTQLFIIVVFIDREIV